MICEFQKQHALDYAKTAAVLQEVADKRKLLMRRMPARHLTIELTTFRRHETTMEVTKLQKTRTTRMTRSLGRVAQLRACSENGNWSAASTSQQKQ